MDDLASRMSAIYAAEHVYPVDAPPIKRGAVIVEGDRIAAVGALGELRESHPNARLIDLGSVALIPGLVNLHSHVELEALSSLAGPSGFIPWLKRLVADSRGMKDEDWKKSARLGARRLLEGGITATADISRTGAGTSALAEAGMRGVSYHEVILVDQHNFESATEKLESKLRDAGSATAGCSHSALRMGVSPHSPYSVAGSTIERLSTYAKDHDLPLAIHVAETVEEVELIEKGSGVLSSIFRPLVRSEIPMSGTELSPVAYLESKHALGLTTLAIHCVQLDDADIEILKMNDTPVALCPTSNELLGVGDAPVSTMREAGVKIGFGTDSAASNPRMDLFEEARSVSRLAKEQSDGRIDIGSEELLEMATLGGARILGLDGDIGSLTPGKLGDMVAIELEGRDPSNLMGWAGRDNVAAVILGGIISSFRRSQ